jgi:hypothetical protein
MGTNNKQTSIEWLEEILKVILYHLDCDELERIEQVFNEAKIIQFKEMQQYAEFCVLCDREKLPLLCVEDWYANFKVKCNGI